MKFVSGSVIVFYVACLLFSATEYALSQPYRDGETATGVVVDNAASGADQYGIVEFVDVSGAFRTARLSSGGWQTPGTQLEISYRPGNADVVRAPGIRTFEPGYTLLWLAFGIGIAVLYGNDWSERRSRALLNGSTLREPEVLVAELKRHVEPELAARIHTAFPVMHQRAIRPSSMALLVGCGMLAGGVTVLVLYRGPVALVLCLPFIFAAAVKYSQHRLTLGVVAATEEHFVLLPTEGRDLRTVQVLAQVPRSTRLPPVADGTKGWIVGGPLPFPGHAKRHGWRYHATSTGDGLTFLHTVRGLIADAEIRVDLGDACHMAKPDRVSAQLLDDTGATTTVKTVGNIASAASYLDLIDPFTHLTPETVQAALPVRSTRDLGPSIRFFRTSTAHSVFVTATSYHVVRHKSLGRTEQVVATHGRATTGLGDALASSGYRLDRCFAWVGELALDLQA